MQWLQWGVLLVGLVTLLFFVVFTGYYFRNRHMALEARGRAGPEGTTAEVAEADEAGTHSAQE